MGEDREIYKHKDKHINKYIHNIIKESIKEELLYCINNNYSISDDIIKECINYNINIEDYIND